MKKTVITFVITILSIVYSFSQNCSKFYPFDEGTTSQITTYDKKGKVSAIVDNKVLSVSKAGGKETAIIEANVKNSKGKIVTSTNYTVYCQGSMVSVDFKSLMNPQAFEQFGKMDMDITGTNIEIPNNLSIGQKLADANMTMSMNMSGMALNMGVTITNRKVEGKETITTPAGTFNCYIISYVVESKMAMGTNQKSNAKQWIAENVGIVKQEDYDSDGKISNSTLLTSFSQ